MPELPDVEIFHRLVFEHCRGRMIDRAVVSDAGILEGISAPAFERRLKGERINSSRRHGKHLFLLLGKGGALAMHFGMNGSLQLVSKASAEPSYTRVRLDFDEGDRLAYVNPRRIGRVSMCDSVEEFVSRSELGPDALDPKFDIRTFRSILSGSKRDIKAVLMDQALMAGVGNIYSDEILFQAGIPPSELAAVLDRERVSRLFRAMRRTLETAIRCRGGSERDTDRLPKNFLLPQRHRGGACPRCGAALTTAKFGGRTAYFCGRCQSL